MMLNKPTLWSQNLLQLAISELKVELKSTSVALKMALKIHPYIP